MGVAPSKTGIRGVARFPRVAEAGASTQRRPTFWGRWVLPRLLRMDIVLLFLSVALLGCGLAFIYGAGQQMGGDYATLGAKQVLWISLGVVLHFAVAMTDLSLLGKYAWLLYLGGLALLLVVLVFGREINGARSWLAIGPFTLQPAELMKPAAIVAMAWAASRPGVRMERGDRIVVVLALAAVPMALTATQPDYGTALVFLPICIVILFLGGIRWKWILASGVLVAALAPVGYRFGLAPHQQERIRTFFNPASVSRDADWNAHQSMLAVGSGGMTGKGHMQGTQYVLGYLPQTVASTDFIFSVIAEETGFVGAGTVLAAFLGILLCALRAAAVSPTPFGSYLAAGVATMITVHVCVNVGMTVRVAPIIGIPLPLVSYGGSFMVATMICLGLIQNVTVDARLHANA